MRKAGARGDAPEPCPGWPDSHAQARRKLALRFLRLETLFSLLHDDLPVKGEPGLRRVRRPLQFDLDPLEGDRAPLRCLLFHTLLFSTAPALAARPGRADQPVFWAAAGPAVPPLRFDIP